MTVEPQGTPKEQPEIVLAGWGTRFWAWLVDFIIVNVALGVLFSVLALPIWLSGLANPGMMIAANGQWWSSIGGPFSFAINSLVFFAYWLYMESKNNGQSVGKMLLHIKTTDLEGKTADPKSIGISSFGKALILPIDVVLGWIFTNDKRQRLLSRAADTIVVKIAAAPADDIHYKRA